MGYSVGKISFLISSFLSILVINNIEFQEGAHIVFYIA